MTSSEPATSRIKFSQPEEAPTFSEPPAPSLPHETLVDILANTLAGCTTIMEEQTQRRYFGGVGRGWYIVSKDMTQFAVLGSSRASKLVKRIKEEKEEYEKQGRLYSLDVKKLWMSTAHSPRQGKSPAFRDLVNLFAPTLEEVEFIFERNLGIGATHRMFSSQVVEIWPKLSKVKKFSLRVDRQKVAIRELVGLLSHLSALEVLYLAFDALPDPLEPTSPAVGPTSLANPPQAPSLLAIAPPPFPPVTAAPNHPSSSLPSSLPPPPGTLPKKPIDPSLPKREIILNTPSEEWIQPKLSSTLTHLTFDSRTSSDAQTLFPLIVKASVNTLRYIHLTSEIRKKNTAKLLLMLVGVIPVTPILVEFRLDLWIFTVFPRRHITMVMRHLFDRMINAEIIEVNMSKRPRSGTVLISVGCQQEEFESLARLPKLRKLRMRCDKMLDMNFACVSEFVENAKALKELRIVPHAKWLEEGSTVLDLLRMQAIMHDVDLIVEDLEPLPVFKSKEKKA